jgi:hypothetical protein
MRLRFAAFCLTALCVASTPAQAREITFYGTARTKSFVAYCKPGLSNKRGIVYRRCDTVWNAFKEGYFAGLDTAGKTCFIERAQLSDLIAHIEGKGEDYVEETGWLFTMRDFVKLRLKECEEKRGRNSNR